MTTRALLLWTIALTAGCAASKADDSANAASSVDERETLLAADRAWAAAASSNNVDSTLTFWTDDARVIQPGAPTLVGKDAIRKMVTESAATPGFHITWTPAEAVISRAGDMGYTTGTNEVTVPAKGGKTTRIPGRYVTIWQKGADGRWRCVLDFGTTAPAPTPAGTAG